MMRTIIDRPDLTIYQGNADEYDGIPDLVVTNPYGFLPRQLAIVPAIIHQWENRKHDAERWTHMALPRIVAAWNDTHEVFWENDHVTYRRDPDQALDFSMYCPEPGGWYPEAMVRTLLAQYAKPGMTIWDGFMGRGTVGKVALAMGCRYIGVEQLEAHIALALDYLGVEKT